MVLIQLVFMQILKYIAWFFWKVWFYLLMAVVILLLSPLLIISLSNERWYGFFFRLARLWAYILFYSMGFRYQLHDSQPLDKHGSYMFVANHTSMMDIMLMLILNKNPFVFIGKKELEKMPLFGFFYKKASITVDRSSSKSRKESIEKARQKLSNGMSICIFPEGQVPDEGVILDEFKDGAFRLAIDFQIPVVAYTFVGLKQHFPYRFWGGKPGKVEVYMHPLFQTDGLTQKDKPVLKQKVRDCIIVKLED